MIDGLKNLSPLMSNFIARLVDAAKASAAADGRRHVDIDIGLSHGSIHRAALFFRTNVSAADEDVAEAGTAFVHTWCMAEAAAMRRVMAAISAAAARGREVEIVHALMKGADIEEALAGSDSAQVTQQGNVVTLRPQRVTDTPEAE